MLSDIGDGLSRKRNKDIKAADKLLGKTQKVAKQVDKIDQMVLNNRPSVDPALVNFLSQRKCSSNICENPFLTSNGSILLGGVPTKKSNLSVDSAVPVECSDIGIWLCSRQMLGCWW